MLQVLKFDPDHKAAKQAFNKVKSIYKLKSQVRCRHDGATSTQPVVLMLQVWQPRLQQKCTPRGTGLCPAAALQGESAEQQQDWQEAEFAFSQGLLIDQTAQVLNAALWLGLCRARFHLYDGEQTSATVQACDNVAVLNPEDTQGLIYKVGDREYHSCMRTWLPPCTPLPAARACACLCSVAAVRVRQWACAPPTC